MTAARGEYLFSLAHVCHIGPREVDKLRLTDFGQLTMGIDELMDPDGG